MEWVTKSSVKRTSSHRLSSSSLHFAPGQRIEGGKGFVHQQNLGCSASARAMATRCFIRRRAYWDRHGETRRAPPYAESIRTLLPRSPRPTAGDQREGDVFCHRFPRRQLVKLLKTIIRSGPGRFTVSPARRIAPETGGKTRRWLSVNWICRSRTARAAQTGPLARPQTDVMGGLHQPLAGAVLQINALNAQQRRR
jgi:hypothetical protein